jgi:hypothetical protein
VVAVLTCGLQQQDAAPLVRAGAGRGHAAGGPAARHDHVVSRTYPLTRSMMRPITALSGIIAAGLSRPPGKCLTARPPARGHGNRLPHRI